MKIIILLMTLLVAGSTANFLDLNKASGGQFQETNAALAYTSTMPCGGCIRSGNIYCVKNVWNKKCCQTEADCVNEIADPTYNCSNAI